MNTEQTNAEIVDITLHQTRALFAEHGVRLERLHEKLQDLVGAAFIRGASWQVAEQLKEVRKLRQSE